MRVLLGALIGLFLGLWFSERERRVEQQKVAARPDRNLEEMSEAYKKRRASLYDYKNDEIAVHIDHLARELVQPNMTPLEAERVATEISEIARKALGYELGAKMRNRKREERTNQWLDDLENGASDE